MNIYQQKLYAAEGGAGGGGTGAGAGADAGAGDGAGTAGADGEGAGAGAGAEGAKGAGTAAAAAAAAAAYRPEGLPDHLYGASDKETIEKLYKTFDGFRKAQSERGEVPGEAKGYTFEPAEAVKPYMETLESDKFFDRVKGFALKAQIPAKQFGGFINDVLNEMIAGDLVQSPWNPETERAALVPNEKDPAKRATEADRIVRENIALVDQWKAQGLPDDVHKFLTTSLDHAAANKLVDWIAARSNETRPALGGAPTSGVTEDTLNARIADPRNKVDGPKFDKAFAAETTKMFKAFYGEGSRA